MSRAKLAPLLADADRDRALGAAVRAIVERTGACVLIHEEKNHFSCAGAETVEPCGSVTWLPEINARSLDRAAEMAAKHFTTTKAGAQRSTTRAPASDNPVGASVSDGRSDGDRTTHTGDTR